MKDRIYSGWGNRQRAMGALKRKLTGLGKTKEQAKLETAAEQIYAELKQLELDTPEGVARLAGFIAEDIIQSFDHAPDDVTDLPFYRHLQQSIFDVFCFEGYFNLPSPLADGGRQSTSQLWETQSALSRVKCFVDELDTWTRDIAQLFRHFVTPIVESHPSLVSAQLSNERKLTFSVPLSMVMGKLPEHIEHMLTLCFAPEFEELGSTARLQQRLEYNIVMASGGIAGQSLSDIKSPKLPTKVSLSNQQLIEAYIGGTPLADLFDFSVPIGIANETRFEHQHIVAGTGHGKTQTLQHLILHDLQAVSQGNASLVVLDSQGDLIKNISELSVFAPNGPLSDKLIVIDPTDVEYPVALNLFDVGMERINEYSQLDREKMINGVLELYDFVLGSLLDAQMTQKQSVIFRYITRLLLHIPDATIITLRELLEEDGSEKYREYINTLQGSARAFFETEFDSREFTQTKKQVLRRLWGILENQSFERMFLHPKNKLDLFSEMNRGKVILINTAKDLLKEDGTQIFGRFFIAMIAQAAQERAVIAKDQRMPTFVYIDEAQDYFDRNIEIILSQARKYKVGMILAHQYLGQLDSKLQEAFFSNASIKFAGGVSSKDARAFASEMKTDASFIEAQDKLSFAAYVRGTTKKAVSLSVTYGQMERLPTMSEHERLAMREKMRAQFATHYTEAGQCNANNTVDGVGKAEPDVEDNIQKPDEATTWD